MQEYLDTYASVISDAQKESLQTFLSQANSSALNISPLDVSAMLSDTGEKLFYVPANITNPDEYNKAIVAAITDLTSLYRELDSIDAANTANANINRAEIQRITAAVDILERVIENKIALNKNIFNYTDAVHENFYTDNGDRSVLPAGVRPLGVDASSRVLKRQELGRISKTLSAGNNAMCKVTVENILGISTETRHAIDQAFDGSYDTYWREVILSDAPINANKSLVNWLPSNYDGGAAVKLRIDFDYLTPITEIDIKPITPYPMKVAEVAWSTKIRNDKDTGSMVPINGNFSDGDHAGWVVTNTNGGSHSVDATAGWDGGRALKVITSTSSSMCTVARDMNLSPGACYSVSFYIKRDNADVNIDATMSSIYQDKAGAWVVSDFWMVTPTNEMAFSEGYQFVTYYCSIPAKVAKQTRLTFTVRGAGTVFLDDIQLANDIRKTQPDQEITDSSVLMFNQERGNSITCKSLWITLVQPQYTLRTYTLPKGLLDIKDLWTRALEEPESGVLSYEKTGKWKDKLPRIPTKNPERGSAFLSEVTRLGGRVKDLILQLYNYAVPSTETEKITKYEYIMGAWEINLSYAEYAVDGMWVSKPLNITGEIRELRLAPQVNAGKTTSINYYITARSGDVVDTTTMHKLDVTTPSGMCLYFKPNEESAGNLPSDRTVVVTPVLTSVSFDGTDRNHMVALPSYPYINMEKVMAIQSVLTTGDITRSINYNPNSAVVSYLTSAPISGRIPTRIATLSGYRPIEVTLRFDNDLVVRPDVVGAGEATLTKIVNGETLFFETDGVTLTESSERVAAKVESGNDITKKVVEENKLTQQTYVTNFPVEYDATAGKGYRVSLYWRMYKDAEGKPVSGLSASSMVLVHPNNYKVTQVGGGQSANNVGKVTNTAMGKTRITVNDDGFNQLRNGVGGSLDRWELVAYYRTKVSVMDSMNSAIFIEDYQVANSKVSGITDLLTQSYPVTRNMTDYWNGETPKLTKSNMTQTSLDYYPVYEYYVDKLGRVVFADDLFRYGDARAQIDVTYKTLDINPRVIIEIKSYTTDGTTPDSPLIYGYSVLLNTRR